MTSLAWLAASSRAAFCSWASSRERPPGLGKNAAPLPFRVTVLSHFEFALKFKDIIFGGGGHGQLRARTGSYSGMETRLLAHSPFRFRLRALVYNLREQLSRAVANVARHGGSAAAVA